MQEKSANTMCCTITCHDHRRLSNSFKGTGCCMKGRTSLQRRFSELGFFLKQLETFYFIFSTKLLKPSAHLQKVLVWRLVHWNTIYLVTSWDGGTIPFVSKFTVPDSRILAFLKQIAVHYFSPSTYFIQTFTVLNAKGQSPYKSCIIWSDFLVFTGIAYHLSFFLSRCLFVYIFLSL